MAAQNQNDDNDVISGINVTPLVDVTLVLLIIFMVTASVVVTNSIPVDLPEAASGEQVSSTVVIYVNREGTLHLDGQPVEDAALQATLRAAREDNAELRAIISADRSIQHARFVRAVDIVRSAGISRFAIDVNQRPADDGEDRELARLDR